MLKEHEPPKEPLRVKAERKWRNNEVVKRLKEEKQKPKLVDPDKEPEPAELIINDGRLDGPIKRLENRFKKEIRDMMEGHTRRNLQLYAASIERRRYVLLKEKLRRLRLAQQMEISK